jgi:hypothetical protein
MAGRAKVAYRSGKLLDKKPEWTKALLVAAQERLSVAFQTYLNRPRTQTIAASCTVEY